MLGFSIVQYVGFKHAIKKPEYFVFKLSKIVVFIIKKKIKINTQFKNIENALGLELYK